MEIKFYVNEMENIWRKRRWESTYSTGILSPGGIVAPRLSLKER